MDLRSLYAGGQAMQPRAGGAPMGARGLQNRLIRTGAKANRFVMPGLRQLFEQANTNRFTDPGRSAFLEPRLQAIDQAQNSAEGHLTQNLQARGLGDSSAMTGGLANLYSAGGAARSRALTDLYGAEDQRQQGAQGDLRSYLLQLMGMGGNAAGQQRGQDLQQDEFDASQEFDWGGLLSSLGGAAGSFMGAGGAGSLASLFRRRPTGMTGSGWPGGGAGAR